MDPPRPVTANRSAPNAILVSWLVIVAPLRGVQVIPSGDVDTTPVYPFPVLYEPIATNPFVAPPYATPQSEPGEPVARSAQGLPSAELRMRQEFCTFCATTQTPPNAASMLVTPERSSARDVHVRPSDDGKIEP